MTSGEAPAPERPLAVVTGASRGIGAATAQLLAARGHDVVVAYRSADAAAARVVEACRDAGVRALAHRGDLTEPAAVDALFAAADAHGRLTVLVNNAGVVDRRARVEQMTAERVSRMLAANVVAPFLCAGAAVRRMARRHGGAGGAIVNVSSAAARIGGADRYVDYAASKGAIDTMTIGLAAEVAADGIRVNAVRPGIIDTDIHADAGTPGRAREIGPSLPLGRAGRAEEVAEAIVWLCSPASSYVTGAFIDVAGGR